MNVDEVIGYFTYRSFVNRPVGAHLRLTQKVNRIALTRVCRPVLGAGPPRLPT
jgi:hypothetical protein